MILPSDLIKRLCSLMNHHEIACVVGTNCKVCANFRHLKSFDQDIDDNLIKNYCKSDIDLVNKIEVKKIDNKAQRIHIIGNHWPLLNSLKHRKFDYFSVFPKSYENHSICITDTNLAISKMENKLIITQGYSKDYNLDSVDYLFVQKRYVDKTYDIPFNKDDIPTLGFFVIDLRTNEKFYTCEKNFSMVEESFNESYEILLTILASRSTEPDEE